VAPAGQYALDPVLGRIAVAQDLPVPDDLQASYRYGFSADIGGGEYPRPRAADATGTTVVHVPSDQPTIQAALGALGGNGVIEITDSGRYEETFSIAVAADGHVRLRAAAQCWPTVILGAPLTVTGGTNSECTLDGVRIAGEPVHVPAGGGNALARLRLAHVTLVPGLSLDHEGDPVAPGEPSLVIEQANVTLELERAIVGAVRMARGASFTASDSIIDATEPELAAFIAPDELDHGGAFSVEACTVIGAIVAREMPLVSNSLLFARRVEGATEPAVRAEQRQSGCVRFTYLPFDALAPRRYRCQPDAAEGVTHIAPRFTSLRYGIAAYCQLGRTTPDAIRRGADDESEMGAFHSLFAPQRETNLEIRLAEYLRVGLNAGIFYAS
jgi:hypothetical protein